MEGKKHLEHRYVKLFLIATFTLGLIGHTLEMTRGLMITLTPLILTLASVVVCYSFLRTGNRTSFVWCITTFTITYFAEIIGVKTGVLFGTYHYGDILGFKLLGVPLIIGINWMLVILGSIALTQQITQNVLLTSLITGLLAVAFDYILEPVAISLGYWHWSGGTPPFKNYCTWFVLVFLSTLLYGELKLRVHTTLPRFYLVVQTVFFLSLQIVLKK
jgi:putative membrane protein